MAKPAALPEREPSRPAEQQGLFRKFDVRRVDGSDAPGGKHHGCRYFVLDVDHDPHSVDALMAYAAACEKTHPELAKDLRTEWQVPSPSVPPQGEAMLAKCASLMEVMAEDAQARGDTASWSMASVMAKDARKALTPSPTLEPTDAEVDGTKPS